MIDGLDFSVAKILQKVIHLLKPVGNVSTAREVHDCQRFPRVRMIEIERSFLT
jgi:hypothetical protein